MTKAMDLNRVSLFNDFAVRCRIMVAMRRSAKYASALALMKSKICPRDSGLCCNIWGRASVMVSISIALVLV